jgi:hypothetical protein
MDDLDVESLYELDKLTLGPTRKKELLAQIQAAGFKYKPYFDRIGPGLSVVACEIKREIDLTVTPLLAKHLSTLTEKRFKNIYADVRIYPQGQEFEQWSENGSWYNSTLSVLVSFVVAIPPDDSLDSMIRIDLVSLFDADSSNGPYSPVIQKAHKKHKLFDLLNVEAVSGWMGECSTDDFLPHEFNGFSLEIIFDGCAEEDHQKMSQLAWGPAIQAKKSQTLDFQINVPVVTAKNTATSVPILIASFAKALGYGHLDPKKLKRNDSLLALMGYDLTLTASLKASFSLHFNIISSIGGERLLTVGNCIDFAEMFADNLTPDMSDS